MTYNGHPFKDFRVQRTATYIEQEDVHMGELTVNETFDFAARCMGSATKKGALLLVSSTSQEALAASHGVRQY